MLKHYPTKGTPTPAMQRTPPPKRKQPTTTADTPMGTGQLSTPKPKGAAVGTVRTNTVGTVRKGKT
jgi:hypothetical protein